MVKGSKSRRNESAILIFSSNVRKYRTMAGLTLTELADKLNIDYAHIGRIERGQKNPTLSTIFDIAAALNVEAAKLLEPEQNL